MSPAAMFPTWQISRGNYAQLCAYLSLTPRDAIYERLWHHLAEAPFRHTPVVGFAAYLALLKPTPFRIARLDLVTKRLFPTHPFRHAINAIVALHECDGRGYAELSRAPSGPWLLPSLIAWGGGFLASVLVSLPWLAWHAIRYKLTDRASLNLDLRDRQVLITGVARGLGRDLFCIALEQGAHVIGTVRTAADADALRHTLPQAAPARIIVGDLSQEGQIPDALRRADVRPGDIHIAILNAGTKRQGASALSVTDIAHSLRVNFLAQVELAAWLCAGARDAMLVLVSSIGRWHGMPHSGGYNASKAALSIWADGLAMELAAERAGSCHVLTVEPGLFASAMVHPDGVMRLLAVPSTVLARRILAAARRRRSTLRYPFGFSALTFGLAAAGRGVRGRVFAKLKGGASR